MKHLQMLGGPILLKCSLVDYHCVMEVSENSYTCDEDLWTQALHEM